eukprot:TRINITY_DN17030_c0_g1_i1.p1 TRINITY_DN17030_c0_g1~~TRINITY_DN17030_c0_g1_i1.p1  ORF type:complete len:240 (+),score=34.16 TRINITY_DN17030_c0_g1_i1:241-960(+)
MASVCEPLSGEAGLAGAFAGTGGQFMWDQPEGVPDRGGAAAFLRVCVVSGPTERKAEACDGVEYCLLHMCGSRCPDAGCRLRHMEDDVNDCSSRRLPSPLLREFCKAMHGLIVSASDLVFWDTMSSLSQLINVCCTRSSVRKTHEVLPFVACVHANLSQFSVADLPQPYRASLRCLFHMLLAHEEAPVAKEDKSEESHTHPTHNGNPAVKAGKPGALRPDKRRRYKRQYRQQQVHGAGY